MGRCGQLARAAVASPEEQPWQRMRLYSFNESVLSGFILHVIEYAKDSPGLFQMKEYTGGINMCVCNSSAV